MPSVYAKSKILLDELVQNDGTGGLTCRTKYRIEGVSRDAGYLAFKAAQPLAAPIDYAFLLPALSGPVTNFDGSSLVGARPAPAARGDKRSIITSIAGTGTFFDLYCMNKSIRHVPSSPDHFIVMTDFEEIGLPIPDIINTSATTNVYSWLVSASINGASIPVRTNFSWVLSGTNEQFGQLSQLWYKPGVANYDGTAAPSTTAAEVAAGTVLSQYANLPSLESISTFAFNMREIVHPSASHVPLRSIESKVAYFNGAMNSAAIWGLAAKSLRVRAMVHNIDVMRNPYLVNPDGVIAGSGITGGRSILRDTTYIIEHRLRGWQEIATLKMPWTGFEPPDIDNPAAGILAGSSIGNGWRRSSPLLERDFSLLNLPDLRTF